MTVLCLWTGILFVCGSHSFSRERCRTCKRGEPEKFTPWLQIACRPCHNTSSENCFCGLTSAVDWPYFNSHSKLHLRRHEQLRRWKNTVPAPGVRDRCTSRRSGCAKDATHFAAPLEGVPSADLVEIRWGNWGRISRPVLNCEPTYKSSHGYDMGVSTV
jgi:hypothetical protein